MNRRAVALVAGVTLCTLIVTPLVLAIKYFDWGVSLVFVSPLLVWLLLRLGRALEQWSRDESSDLPPDPDYPDEPL